MNVHDISSILVMQVYLFLRVLCNSFHYVINGYIAYFKNIILFSCIQIFSVLRTSIFCTAHRMILSSGFFLRNDKKNEKHYKVQRKYTDKNILINVTV